MKNNIASQSREGKTTNERSRPSWTSVLPLALAAALLIAWKMLKGQTFYQAAGTVGAVLLLWLLIVAVWKIVVWIKAR